MSIVKTVEVNGTPIHFEFQKFAKQAHGSVMVSCGETQVLVTVCAASEPREGQDFFPLTVDYIEKFYAAGKIPGGFIKRETKPSEREALTSRLIDRPLRPCFPKGYLCDTQIIATVVSADGVHSPTPLAAMGASTALMVSEIPFDGPVALLTIGKKGDEFIIDPQAEDTKSFSLSIAANPDAVLMVEAEADFVSEAEMLNAIDFAHKAMEPIFAMQKEVQKEIGKEKRTVEALAVNTELSQKVQDAGKSLIEEAFRVQDKKMRGKALKEASQKILAELNPDKDSGLQKQLNSCIDDLKYNTMRDAILNNKVRIDGRSPTDIRPIACETGLLKRAHGSSLFTRGETQALGIATLGSSDDEQRMDSIFTSNGSKAFMLHYNFPPFSVGEARPLRSPGRREIGHGNLAERALVRVIPERKTFNYAIRLVSETLESNGSSSMAAVCAGTMALRDAGVPISQAVAGIAMGLIKKGDQYVILSDILGDEDHLGDMDFKVTGSDKGLTALQMDIKIGGLSRQILEEALNQAKEGRCHILKHIEDTISQPNELSEYAPRIFQIKVKTDKVRDLIGPGGKVIKGLVAEYGVKIDIDDNGIVHIIAPNNRQAEQVKTAIRKITADPEVGEVLLGSVKRTTEYGAFVEIKPGTEGLLHISQLAHERVESVEDIIREGEQVMVKIIDVDRQGRIKLSRKDALNHKPKETTAQL